MSTGQLRSANSLAGASKLDKLDALTPWTEEAETRPPDPQSDPVELDKPTVVTRSRGRPLKHRDYVSPVSDDPDRPWANLPQPAAMKTMTVRLPMEMYQELKWYGETTYGASMNDIVIQALIEELGKRRQAMKARR